MRSPVGLPRPGAGALPKVLKRDVEEKQMMDRRDILKKFGIGTIIAPLIGGAVDQSSAAK